MLLARSLDERMWLLNRQGKLAFVISCQGHEAAQVGTAFALDPGRDWILPYYRDLGVVLTAGMTPREVMLHSFSKAADPNSGGRQMPSHWSHARLKIVTTSSPVITQVLHAAGIALATKMRGEEDVAFVSFGEGATSQGDFHEALNFASIHKLPVIFLCENNNWAISTPLPLEMAVPGVARRAAAYNIPGIEVDGGDPLLCYAAMRQAIARARRGEGPTLLEARVTRLTPHSSDDDNRYRAPEELKVERSSDPLPRFATYLREQGILGNVLEKKINQSVNDAVNDATDFAEGAPDPSSLTAQDHVYSRG
ncbi:MAG: thiamine pyrophosphate-dependent dehydrogenase E1 component subunit alpha [Chloroflexi bacterium]|nr:thiamine pyrophosphate-dependent dehydrogenase E1 component subunit alpha [Chloroflexota bacterium]